MTAFNFKSYRKEILRTCPDATEIMEAGEERASALKFELLGNGALGLVGEAIELMFCACPMVPRNLQEVSTTGEILEEVGDLLWYSEVIHFCLDLPELGSTFTIEDANIPARIALVQYENSNKVTEISLDSDGRTDVFPVPVAAMNFLSVATQNAVKEAGSISELYKKMRYQGKELTPLVRSEICTRIGCIVSSAGTIAHVLGSSLWGVARLNILKLRERYPDGFSVERSENR